MSSLITALESAGLLRIPLKDVKQATNNFAAENFIERDDFGKVYKGELLRPEGFVTMVFKRLDRALGQGEAEFWIELMLLSKYRHENIDSLVGFSNDSDEIILVYIFPIHGSLDKCLTSAQLTWLKRLKICLGAAHGLKYLHCPPGTQRRVVHRNIKSANILLDNNWHAKIANLGLRKQVFYLLSEAIETDLYVDPLYMETGYADPIYIETGILSKESDIYSFGVVLFEVLCGRLAIIKDGDDTQVLSSLACHHYENGKLTEIINPILRKQMNQDSFNVFSTIAYQCLKRNRHERPTTSVVVEKLEEAFGLQHEFEKALALQQEEVAHLRIPLEDIEEATNNFAIENLIGIDDFGKTYEGALSRLEGIVTVSFKRLEIALEQGLAGFQKEIMLLSTYKHENIVCLVGYCNERDEMILVHEFPTHGGLNKYLGSAKLTWLKRLEICLDAARGLNYLHMRVIHRDMKSENILLDENWHAKIANFGLSKIGPENQEFTFLVSDAVGTIGYTDPLYIETGILSKESDIYSFGVILFEVLCGRLAITKDGDDIQDLGRLACRHYEDSKLSEIIDPVLRKQMSPDSLDVFSSIAYQCLKRDRNERPTIFELVEKLEEVVGLQQDFEKALALQQGTGSLESYQIPLKEIKLATGNFNPETRIGNGGFGVVYRGQLWQNYTVAIKCLDPECHQGNNEFCTELKLISSFRHPNIIPFVGYCDEDGEMIIVYQYASNRSLDYHLADPIKRRRLHWVQRLKICLGAAKGLDYLHSGLGNDKRVIHRDVKSGNILLDENMEAKICDFGLSKEGPRNQQCTVIYTKAAGTNFYLDPVYHESGILSKESDVYSFGVVLFELLSGRLAYLLTKFGDGKPQYLINLVRRYYNDKPEILIDPDLRDQIHSRCFHMFRELAYQCISLNLKERPTMNTIIDTIENAMNFQIVDGGEAAVERS